MHISKNNEQISFATLTDLTDLSFEKILKNDSETCPYLENFVLSTINSEYSKVNFLTSKIKD